MVPILRLSNAWSRSDPRLFPENQLRCDFSRPKCGIKIASLVLIVGIPALRDLALPPEQWERI